MAELEQPVETAQQGPVVGGQLGEPEPGVEHDPAGLQTRCDELPQLLHVISVKMSLIGPRPERPELLETLTAAIPYFEERCRDVAPGITGLAQVNGYRGETDTVDKMKGRIEYDLAYLRNWSLLLDFQIILKTAVVVLQKQNAY